MFDAGPRDAGPPFVLDAGPRDAGPRRDAAADPCATSSPELTSGCHGGQGLYSAAPANSFGGTCTITAGTSGPGSCVGAGLLCRDYTGTAGTGICVRSCLPSAATTVSTGDCPVGSRCFVLSDIITSEQVCIPDCADTFDCATGACASDGSCIDT